MNGLFEQLHQDHINYSRLLNLLEVNLELLAAREKADFLIMKDILKYMINYPDIHHHPAEELMFKELGERAGKEAAVIDRLYREHSLLADLAQQLEDQLKIAISGHIVSRDVILELGRHYVDTYREHIKLEEREVFPLLEASLGHEARNRIKQRLTEVSDPVFSNVVSDEYQRLFRSITEPVTLET